MLTEKIEDTFATVFRQISMNRFEDKMHNARRSEGELTAERFNELWLETQRDMFGDSVTITDEYGSWWSYVPHFLHTPGYVYAYSFGELLVLALYKHLSRKKASASYLSISTCWPPAIPIIPIGCWRKSASISMIPSFWQKGIDVIEEWVAEAESLSRELVS